MTQELQALLERINEDGVNRARAESEKIIGEAKKEAEKIVAEARSEAEQIVKEAKDEAELLIRKGEESLRQASRDILLSLREQLQKRLIAVVKKCIASESDGEAFAKAIADTVGKQLAESPESELEVMVAEKDRQVITEHLFAALGRDLQENVHITPLPDLEGGFRLRFDKSDVIYDFSDSALTDTVTAFLGPRLVEIIESADRQNEKKENDNDDKREGKEKSSSSKQKKKKR